MDINLNQDEKNQTENVSNNISIDDFKKVEISVGEIVSIEKVENADKLLKLKVNFGDYERQILSGIAEYFEDPQTLVGLKFPFVTNLEPRIIRGLESNGMIMAAKDEQNNFSLLNINQKIKNGTRIS
jgi:methionyl-tRNA synthetase